MALLNRGDNVAAYQVQTLIKENLYTETYRVADDDGNPFFLKLFVNKRMPVKLVNQETGQPLEVEYSKTVKHKNIISYVADGTTPTVEGNCSYYVTNYFNGELLVEKIQREGRIAADEAEKIFTCVLEGLKCLHDMYLCHNDITPRNIMLPASADAEPVIIDLGHLSPRCGGRGNFDVADLEVLYSANETFAGMFDEQSDVFAATAVLYAMLFGQAPWQLDFEPGLKRSQKAKALKEFRRQHPIDVEALDIPQRLKVVIAKGITLSYSERYHYVPEVLKDLEATADAEVPKKKNKAPQSPQQGGLSRDTESPNKVDFEIKKGEGGGFNDIAGMKDLKDYLQQKVIFVIKNKEKMQRYRLTPPNGMLLYGPPGCGKSFVAEKFAEETGFNFIMVKSSDLASSFHHGSQEKIAQLFKQAEKKAPIVICFDEFDALVPDRSNIAAQYSATEVNEFLTQLNNCSKRGIFVVGTTNRPDKIDPAVLRTGRIDKQVYVPLPDREARREMFLLHLKDRPYDPEHIDADRLSDMSEGYIASDIAYVVNDAAMIAAYTDQDITEQLLEESVRNTKPSLRPDALKIYDDIRQKMESNERRNLTRPSIGFSADRYQ